MEGCIDIHGHLWAFVAGIVTAGLAILGMYIGVESSK